MSKQANPTIIGAFVLGGCILAIGILILLGEGSLHKEKHNFIMFFEGSANGLNVGSPVRLRGVQVGTVKKVSVINDFTKGEIHIPVIIELYPDNITDVGDKPVTPDETVKKLVEEYGLRASLQTQSILTGQLYVQLDYHPGTEYKFHGSDEYIEIPIIPSTLEILEKKFADFDFAAVIENLSSATTAISELAANPELKQSIKHLDTALIAINHLIHSVDANVIPLSKKTERVLDGLHNTLSTIEQDTLSKIDMATTHFIELSNEDSPVLYRFNTAMDELTLTAKSIRALADSLEQQPEALIRGEKTGK